MITKFNLFENQDNDEKWNRIDKFLKDIRKEFNKDRTWDGFMNFDPSENKDEYDKTTLDIIFAFNKSNKKIYELLLKYDLFVEDKPHENELIITDIIIFFKYLSENEKDIIENTVPGKLKEIERKIQAKKFNI